MRLALLLSLAACSPAARQVVPGARWVYESALRAQGFAQADCAADWTPVAAGVEVLDVDNEGERPIQILGSDHVVDTVPAGKVARFKQLGGLVIFCRGDRAWVWIRRP